MKVYEIKSIGKKRQQPVKCNKCGIDIKKTRVVIWDENGNSESICTDCVVAGFCLSESNMWKRISGKAPAVEMHLSASTCKKPAGIVRLDRQVN